MKAKLLYVIYVIIYMKNMIKLSTDSIVGRLFENGLYYFTVKDLAGVLKAPIRRAYAAVARLEGRGLVRSVERGKYLLLGFEPERVLSNPFFIASQIVYPSYVSFWSALNFYGFTEQVPVVVFIASLRRKRELEFDGFRFKYVFMRRDRFFGYRRERAGELDFLIAEEEKAIVDSLYLPEDAGGMVEVAKAVYNAKGRVDLDKLLAYASEMRSRSLCSRLGYLLERFGLDARALLSHSSREYVRLDQRRAKGRVWDRRWHVNVNLSEEELLGWRET